MSDRAKPLFQQVFQQASWALTITSTTNNVATPQTTMRTNPSHQGNNEGTVSTPRSSSVQIAQNPDNHRATINTILSTLPSSYSQQTLGNAPHVEADFARLFGTSSQNLAQTASSSS